MNYDEESMVDIENVYSKCAEWDSEKGIYKFKNIPITWMYIDTTLAGLLSGFQKMVGTDRFTLALQAEGRKNIDIDWNILSKYKDFEIGFEEVAKNAASGGWGKWELIAYDPESKYCIFRAYNNWEGLYQKSLNVCWGNSILAGKFAGICSKLFNKNCWATQTKFFANGDDYDEFFVNQSQKTIEEEIDNLIAPEYATKAELIIAYQTLKETKDHLYNKDLQLRQIIDLIPAYIAVRDEEGKYILANELVASESNLVPKEMEGKTCEELNVNFPGIKEQLENEKKVIRTNEQMIFPDETLETHNGGTQTLKKIIVPFNSIDNNSKAALSISFDISELKKASDMKDEYIKHLEQMTFSLSHEIRSPVCNILGVIDLLNNVKLSQYDLMELLTSIKDAVQDLDKFTKDMTENIHEFRKNIK